MIPHEEKRKADAPRLEVKSIRFVRIKHQQKAYKAVVCFPLLLYIFSILEQEIIHECRYSYFS